MPGPFRLAILALLGLVTSLQAAEIPVRCPAVMQENAPRTNHPAESWHPIELVVIGAAKPVKGGDDENVYQLQIEKTLYGSWPAKTLLFTHEWKLPAERLIFALAPGIVPRHCDCVVRYTIDPAEEKAITALGNARFDFHVLSSVCIFIGKELDCNENGIRTVEVVRPLAGAAPARGARILTDLADGSRSNEKPKLHRDPEIYFISKIKKDAEIEEGKQGTVYRFACRQPEDQEEKVKAAFRRQEAYPVVEVQEYGQSVKCREVMFLGPVEQAIELLGSGSDPAVTLGSRRLSHDGAKSLPALRAALEKRLFQTTEAQAGDFRKLGNLIRVLGSNDKGGKEIEVQLERLIAHIASQPAEPPEAPERDHRERYYNPEEHREDVNHALVRLLRQVDEARRHQEFGPKLLRLRDQAKGRWQAEVQLALDVGRIEDQIELEAAIKRMADARPIRSRTGIRHPDRSKIDQLAFSADGRYLATHGYGDIRVWDTRDWSLAGTIQIRDGSADMLAFSSDGKLLYVAGYAGMGGLLARYDWRTGKVDKQYEGHKERVSDLLFSADGQVMVSASYFEDIIHIWDPASGKIRQSHQMLGYRLALSADGKTLAYEAKDKELVVVATAGGPPRAIPFAGTAKLNEFAFSPDGKWLVVTHNAWVATEIRLLAVEDDFKEKACAKVEGSCCTAVEISPDSRLVVLGHQEGPVWVYSFPDLKPVRQLYRSEESSSRATCIRFTQDGKLLALACGLPSPMLFRVADWERILPGSGHGDRIDGVFFPTGGQIIRTIGRDNSICLWDAASLQLMQRFLLDLNVEVLGVRPDGQVLLIRPKDRPQAAQVLDADTLRPICDLELPMPERYDRSQCHWLSERELLFTQGKELIRCDYRTGRQLEKYQPDIETPLRGNTGYLSEDKKTFYWLSSNPKYGYLNAQAMELAGGKVEKIGHVQFSQFTGNRCGLVPDGKHFYVSDPGLFFYTRDKLEPTRLREFRDAGVPAFSPDGKRFALATEGRIFIDRQLGLHQPETKPFVRIHETATGKTLGALPTGGRLHFAPGNRLVVIRADDAIELWDLAALPQ